MYNQIEATIPLTAFQDFKEHLLTYPQYRQYNRSTIKDGTMSSFSSKLIEQGRFIYVKFKCTDDVMDIFKLFTPSAETITMQEDKFGMPDTNISIEKKMLDKELITIIALSNCEETELRMALNLKQLLLLKEFLNKNL